MTKINMDHVKYMDDHQHILYARKNLRIGFYQIELKYSIRYEKFYPVQRRPWPNKLKYGRLGGAGYAAHRVVLLDRRFGGAFRFSMPQLNKLAVKWETTFAMRGLVGWRDVAKKRRGG